MSFRASTPFDLDASPFEASASTSKSTLPSAFGRMIQPNRPPTALLVRDRCTRPEPTYNDKYNPYVLPPSDLDKEYSPYAYGEPLYDDRAITVANLPRQHILASAAKRQRTSWVWNLGYALIANSKPNKPIMWACKLCMCKSNRS